ncbi:MAG TPA: hypothetical protein VMN36_00460 [Verrucomicrobiales bacterium]|nr:hypothetical protein [Verrucomicrobiales bacterium]
MRETDARDKTIGDADLLPRVPQCPPDAASGAGALQRERQDIHRREQSVHFCFSGDILHTLDSFEGGHHGRRQVASREFHLDAAGGVAAAKVVYEFFSV